MRLRKFLFAMCLSLCVFAGNAQAQWAQVDTDGFGNTNNRVFYQEPTYYDGYWYMICANQSNEVEVYRSPTGATWTHVFVNGFIDSALRGLTNIRLTVYQDTLYTAISNIAAGMEIWRTTSGTTWTQVVDDGFGTPSYVMPTFLEWMDNALYCGADSNAFNVGGMLRVSTDGATWTQVGSDGFGDGSNDVIHRPCYFDGFWYICFDNVNGVEVWRSSDPDNGPSWTMVNANGFGPPNASQNTIVSTDCVTFQDYIYVAVDTTSTNGFRLFRSTDGTTWAQVGGDGFGSSDNRVITSMRCWDGYIYVGTEGADGTPGRVFRSANGTTWTDVSGTTYWTTDVSNHAVTLDALIDELLIISVENANTGLEVWRTADGSTWTPLVGPPPAPVTDGFGDSGNNACLLFGIDDYLYATTEKSSAAFEVWRRSNDDPVGEIILGTGTYAANGGWAQIFNGATDYSAATWVRLPWTAYNSDAGAGGEVRPAYGDFDGDGRDEIALGLDTYVADGGWVEIKGDRVSGYPHEDWARLNWGAYNAANGETWPCAGDVDGDGRDELLLGIGTYAANGGWVQVLDDQNASFASLAWIRLSWSAYNGADGEVRPACGDLDCDGLEEVVLGINTYAANGGWLQLREDANGSYSSIRWIRVPWSGYNGTDGSTRPACGDLDEDGHAELVVGLGTTPQTAAAGWMALFDDESNDCQLRRWERLPWTTYNNAKGETRPALGDVDGDGRAELVVGIGTYTTNGGWAALYDDFKGSFDHANHDLELIRWIRMGWSAYNGANGEVWPSIERH